MSRNRKVARKSSPWGRAGVVFLVLVAAGFIIASVVWAWANLQQVTLNYQISQAQEVQKQYLELNRKLRIEHSSLISISRLERLAEEQYGMVAPQPSQVVQLP
ncbi:MAG: cell division protein FtsL [Thermodesulfobacteriota bacterium]